MAIENDSSRAPEAPEAITFNFLLLQALPQIYNPVRRHYFPHVSAAFPVHRCRAVKMTGNVAGSAICAAAILLGTHRRKFRNAWWARGGLEPPSNVAFAYFVTVWRKVTRSIGPSTALRPRRPA